MSIIGTFEDLIDGQGDWVDLALCGQTDPEAFFPDKGGETKSAKAMCQRCEVRTECLEYALAQRERYGVWGGYSERERRQMLKELVA